MIEIASRAQLHFEPGESASFAADATGPLYATPAGAMLTIGDFARLKYVDGALRYRLTLSAADSDGEVTISVKSGDTTLGAKTIEFNGSGVYHGQFPVNLSTLYGGSPVGVAVEGNTAAGAGVTATIAAVLDVEHPLVIGVA